MADLNSMRDGDNHEENHHHQDRRSSLQMLDIQNFRRFWSIRKSSTGTEGNHGFMTGEVVPNLTNYQHRMSVSTESGFAKNRRLTLGELFSNNGEIPATQSGIPVVDAEKGAIKGQYKMNWVEGVFMTCLLNIWGVMLFLRLTWVIGEAGLIEGLAILTISNTVTFITSLSMSAVCTNGQITAGGIYYMISRSLGPEFGGAIGLMFVLAQSMAIAMHLIGFCESFLDMLKQNVNGFEDIMGYGRVNDIRLLGMISLAGILILAIVGMNWMTRVQYGLLAILIIAQVDFVIGTMIPPTDEQKAKGFLGYSLDNYKENLYSNYSAINKKSPEILHSFFTVFAVYFPSCTGIVAGANLSGDLKDPAAAIPKGTLLAVGTTYMSYILYAILSAGCSIRYASGIVAEYQYSEGLLNATMIEELNITMGFRDCVGRDPECEYGLIQSQQMIETMSAWGPLIYAGCFAATLSSAIACMFGAPRVFQAVAKDKLYPGLHFFAQGHGPNNDPFRGYGLVFIIAGTCILIGNLNQVSSVLSNFYVAAYALINFSVFHAGITKSPGWRPTFKYHNRWLSLGGTILCLAVMFLMDYKTAVATYICILLLYIIIRSNKPDANWGSSNQSMSFVNALKSVQSLSKVDDHVKTYRPKIILLSGEPSDRPCLMDFANLITKHLSLLQCLNVVEEEVGWETISANKSRINKWLIENKIKAFYSLIRHQSFHKGARIAMEVAGLGKLSPNMMLIGFQEKWSSCPDSAHQYVNALQSAFELHLALGIFRVQGGFDVTGFEISNTSRRLNSISSEFGSDESVDSGISKSNSAASQFDSSSNVQRESNFLGKIIPPNLNKSNKSIYTINGSVIDDPNLIRQITQFKGKDPVRGGTIDVYWLFDDGGLTLLIPFILKMRSKFAKCKLRVFFLANDIENLEEETRNMTHLLKKFRIDFSDVTILSDAKKKPTTDTSKKFEIMISKKLVNDTNPNSPGVNREHLITASDLIKNREKTNFHLRIAEIVEENSKEAALIVMTLPLPKKEGLPPLLYMAWLDFISKNLPPFLFVRGNQVSVLTFYS